LKAGVMPSKDIFFRKVLLSISECTKIIFLALVGVANS